MMRSLEDSCFFLAPVRVCEFSLKVLVSRVRRGGVEVNTANGARFCLVGRWVASSTFSPACLHVELRVGRVVVFGTRPLFRVVGAGGLPSPFVEDILFKTMRFTPGIIAFL